MQDYKIKDKIIYLALLETNKIELLELIQDFASFYHVDLKNKVYRISKKDALLKFILNKEGYNISLLRLYNVFRI